MIDIHTHLLPAMDDGIKDVRETIKILKSYQKNGVKAVCLTPHYAIKRGYNKEWTTLKKTFDGLLEACKKNNLELKLYLGQECDYQEDFIDLLPFMHTLNQTPYMLIDFGQGVFDIEEAIYELKIKGYQILIAHVERYHYLSLDDIIALKKQGARMQVNAKHILKQGSKASNKRALKLLKEDLIDVIASDIHAFEQADLLPQAFEVVKRKAGLAKAKQLFIKNPEKILGISDA